MKSLIRHSYLCLLGFIFTIAFLSFYISYPGLLSSSSGIDPVHRILPHRFPRLNSHVKDIDTLCEGLALVGIVLSCLLACGIIHNAIVYLLVTFIYSILVKLGSTFYSFQWDILLLEAGFLTGVSGYAPWMSLTTISKRGNSLKQAVSAWPLRFLLFKLMILSGVVKIQADCPTWINLTALEYHFATQCLPGPLAWYAHQLHPFLLRLSVAVTLWIEIPVAFLLIAPFVKLRRIGATLQIVLQILIILSGNYNFFNILTIALTLPCMEEDYADNGPSFIIRKIRQFYIQEIFCLTFLGWTFMNMFQFGSINQQWSIKLLMTHKVCDKLLRDVIPVTIKLCLIFIILSSVPMMKKKVWPLTVVQSLVCILCVGTAAVPFILSGNNVQQFVASKEVFIPIWKDYLQEHHVSNSYGLFRRMTGVGEASKYSTSRTKNGWAGQFPSVVERPEIIMEGLFSNNGEVPKWREILFRWKPGPVNQIPKQVAPHQPRLDWQMWFAALGSYQHNPWLINFIDKMLKNCADVIELVNEPNLQQGGEKLLQIQSKLYHYDFTRIQSKWNIDNPSVNVKKWPKEYWNRKFVNTYLPSIESENPSVASFLSSYGYPQTCIRMSKRCSKAKGWKRYCEITVLLRDTRMFWLPMICLINFWIWCTANFFISYREVDHKAQKRKKE